MNLFRTQRYGLQSVRWSQWISAILGTSLLPGLIGIVLIWALDGLNPEMASNVSRARMVVLSFAFLLAGSLLFSWPFVILGCVVAAVLLHYGAAGLGSALLGAAIAGTALAVQSGWDDPRAMMTVLRLTIVPTLFIFISYTLILWGILRISAPQAFKRV